MANIQHSFDALSVSTRRDVLALVKQRVSTAGEIAEHLPVTRSAVSQHLKVLLDAEIVSVEVQGTKRIYRINRSGLVPLATYLNEMWDDALGQFAAFVEDSSA